MANNLPVSFPLGQPQALASYNYTDIEEGTGVVIYYGAKTQNGFILTRNSNLASIDAWSSGVTGSSGTALGDTDFDITFNNPKTMDGKVIVNVPIGKSGGTGNPVTTVVKLYHVRNGVETQLGSTATDTTASISGTIPEDQAYATLEITVPRTRFKVGDTYRINIDVTWSGTGSAVVYVGHDPLNRSSSPAVYYSSLKVFTPFRLNT